MSRATHLFIGGLAITLLSFPWLAGQGAHARYPIAPWISGCHLALLGIALVSPELRKGWRFHSPVDHVIWLAGIVLLARLAIEGHASQGIWFLNRPPGSPGFSTSYQWDYALAMFGGLTLARISLQVLTWRQISRWIGWSGRFFAVYVIVHFMLHDNSQAFFGTRRAVAGLINPNILASLLLLLAGPAVILGQRATTRFLVALLFAVALGMTGSRGAWMGLFVALAAAGWMCRAGDRAGARRALVIMGTLAIATGVLVTQARSLSEKMPTSVSGDSIRGRCYIYLANANMIRTHPLWGVGLGNSVRDLHHYYPNGLPEWRHRQHAHNWLLHATAEQGWVGGALLWGVITILLASIRHLEDPVRCAGWVGIVALLVHSLVDATPLVVSISTLFWFLLGALAATSPGQGRQVDNVPTEEPGPPLPGDSVQSAKITASPLGVSSTRGEMTA